MILFGAIGFAAFLYGKRTGTFPPIVIGILLMAYPYFISGPTPVWLVGAGLCGALYFTRQG
jgi:hypothetical protein